jgi:hypothetical protein
VFGVEYAVVSGLMCSMPREAGKTLSRLLGIALDIPPPPDLQSKPTPRTEN